MAIEVFNRFEHKYILDFEAFKQVISVMDAHMELDSYNENHMPYTIANIYYDTDDDYLIRSSLASPAYKEKLRLRAYGIPQENQKVFLEIKKKYRGIVNKRRTALSLGEAYAFVSTGIAPEIRDYTNEQVIREIAYFLKVYSLKPKLYLAYDRIAYFEKGNADLRISFDTSLRSRRCDLKLEAGDYGNKLPMDGFCLMEIKTSLAKPLWLADMLTQLHINRRSFSKYGTEFRQYINPQKIKKAI